MTPFLHFSAACKAGPYDRFRLELAALREYWRSRCLVLGCLFTTRVLQIFELPVLFKVLHTCMSAVNNR
jgi:hypothetical protein